MLRSAALATAAAVLQSGERVLGYIVRRTGWAVGLFLVVTMYTYILFFLIPYNTVVTVGARGGLASGEASTVRNAVRVHGSFFEEYGTFLWRIVHGDLGRSFQSRHDVTELIWQAAPVTGSLVFGAAVVWLLIALPIGVLSAYRPRSLLDRASMVFVLIGVSLHPLWIGYMLSWYVGFKLRWLPINGYCDVFNTITSCGGPVQWAYHLVLPWFTFSLSFAAIYARMVRASVLETLHEDYVRTARAKGLGEWPVLRSHVLRNAMLPVVTMLGMDMSLAFAGAVFVERVYGLPGIGNLLFNALARRDMPVILGVVVLVTTAILVANLIVDLLYGVLDPRARVYERSRRARAQRRLAAEARGEPAVAAS